MMIALDILLSFVLILAFALAGGVLALGLQWIGDKILDRIGGY
jgi:hypothetical protein